MCWKSQALLWQHMTSKISSSFWGEEPFCFWRIKKNIYNTIVLCLSIYSMMTRMERHTRSKFHLYKASQVFGSGVDGVLLSPLQPAQITGKTSPSHCSQEPPTHPWGQVTFRLPRHKQTVLPSRTTDHWSLERNVQVAIPATRTGSTFDLSASGKSLLFSASQLPSS